MNPKYEYITDIYRISNLSKGMNYMANLGWRVISVMLRDPAHYDTAIVVFERSLVKVDTNASK